MLHAYQVDECCPHSRGIERLEFFVAMALTGETARGKDDGWKREVERDRLLYDKKMHRLVSARFVSICSM